MSLGSLLLNLVSSIIPRSSVNICLLSGSSNGKAEVRIGSSQLPQPQSLLWASQLYRASPGLLLHIGGRSSQSGHTHGSGLSTFKVQVHEPILPALSSIVIVAV